MALQGHESFLFPPRHYDWQLIGYPWPDKSAPGPGRSIHLYTWKWVEYISREPTEPGEGKHSPRYCFGRGGKGRRHWAGVCPAMPSLIKGTYCSLLGEPAVTGGEAKESRQNWRTAFPNVRLRILPRGLPTDLWEYPLNLPARPPPPYVSPPVLFHFLGTQSHLSSQSVLARETNKPRW